MPRQELFRGTGVAIVTPFTETGVDYDKLTELINWQIDAGIDAIIICGTTGEASAMPDGEHIDVIRHAVEVVDKRVPVIAGTGSNDTEHGMRLSQNAEKVGADALLCVTPYYNKTSQRGLVEHFKATAAAVTVPIILYNVPSRTNLNIAPETYEALTEIEHIVGIKECNIHQVAETLDRCGDHYDIYSGEDGLVIPLLSLGGKGVISVAANIVPEAMINLTHSWFDGKVSEAAQQQVELTNLIKALFSDVNPIPVKEALNLMGYAVGECRLPLIGMSESGREHLVQVLKECKLI